MGNLLIKFNNWRSRRKRGRFEPRDILILLPSCLQRSDCPVNIRGSIYDCKRCGRCNVGPVIEVAEKLGIPVFMVTGGREAVNRVRQTQVKAVVAVACNKELTEGVKATFPKPVIGIENRRPNGPCKDTLVDLEELESAINEFLKKD